MSENLGQQPTLDHMISQAAETGWDFFDGPLRKETEARKKISDARGKRLSEIAAALYVVPEFNELLLFLAEVSLWRSQFLSPYGLPPEQELAYAKFREGQNAMVMMIFKMIAQGRDQTIEGREP